MASWRKSSYSNNGGNCIEVSTWRKSTFSGNGGDCVEVGTWRKSTRSNNGGECVEIAATGPVIAVRDSKDPTGLRLDFRPRAWQAFVATLKVAR